MGRRAGRGGRQRLALGERAAHRRRVLGSGVPCHGSQDSTVCGAEEHQPPPSEEQAVFRTAQVHLPIQLKMIYVNQAFYVYFSKLSVAPVEFILQHRNSKTVWLIGDWSMVYHLDFIYKVVVIFIYKK